MIDEKRRRIEVLTAQCKGHQLRREKRAEAAKQAEIGALLLTIDGDERERFEAAAVALARAKRLCRDVLREKVAT